VALSNRPASLVAYRALSDVAGKGAFFVVTVAAARRLSGEAFGVFSLGSTIGWIAAVVTDFGIQLHLAREVAHDPDAAWPLLQRWLRVRLSMAAVAMVLITACLGLTGLGGSYTLALVLLSATYCVNGLVEFLHYFYRGVSRSDIESTLTLCQRGATLVIALLALWWRPDLKTLAFALAVPAVVTLAFSARLASSMARTGGGDTAPSLLPRVALEFGRDVAPIGLGILLSALYFRIDVFLIGWWQGTTAVGLYNSVFRLVEALRLFPAAVLAVALPSLVRANSTRPLLAVSAGLTAFGVATTTVLWVIAGWLVPFLYGPAYADAVPAFRVLLLSFPLMSLNYALTHQLIGWSGHRAYAFICAAALVGNIALNARLIPAFSIVGAAWSTLVTESLLTVCCMVVLWGGRIRTAGSSPLAAIGGS
jgi:O-antigen/teichoic acid export membrane protein